MKERIQEKMWIEEIEEKFGDTIDNIYYVAGVQHVSTPFTLHLSYIIVDDARIMDNDKSSIFSTLENWENPHAWGICANYDSWGNYTCGCFSDDEIDNDILNALIEDAEEEVYSIYFTSDIENVE